VRDIRTEALAELASDGRSVAARADDYGLPEDDLHQVLAYECIRANARLRSRWRSIRLDLFALPWRRQESRMTSADQQARGAQLDCQRGQYGDGGSCCGSAIL